MRLLSVIILLLTVQAANAESACKLQLVASSDLRITDDNKAFIHATIGQETLAFGLDTRIARSVLFHSVVTRLGLPYQVNRELPLDIDGRYLDGVSQIPALTIGNLAWRAQNLVVARGYGTDGSNDTEAGLIGTDLLRSYDIEIDPAGHRFNIFSQDHCAGKVVYWANAYNKSPIHVYGPGEIEMDVELDGQNLHALLATGISTSVLELSTARRRFGIDPDGLRQNPAEPIADLSGGSLPAYSYNFKSLKFGDLTIGNPKINIAPIRTPYRPTSSHIQADFSPDLLIGMSFLRKLHLYIAYQEDFVYYTIIN